MASTAGRPNPSHSDGEHESPRTIEKLDQFAIGDPIGEGHGAAEERDARR